MNQPKGARIMDGAAVARRVLESTSTRAAEVSRKLGRRPCLAAVLVGDDPSSVTYVRMKQKRCESVGIDSRIIRLGRSSATSEVVATIRNLSDDKHVDGILLQHPVPDHVDERAAFEAIAPAKDVDGVTMHSFAAMAFGLPGFRSCTPAGIMRLLDEYAVDPCGLHAVIIGRSPILGRPIGMLLLTSNATVTYCHSYSDDLPEIVGSADIVVAAVGKANFVRGEWLKRGSVVIDAGYSSGDSGDVAFEEARGVAALITPVPGGVGPMTIAMLIEQTALAAERSAS
jgi:methylenetetrahydrofolate dehydrogenase (NADP+) / methenyltetrahydrofolate cyclohydrolase